RSATRSTPPPSYAISIRAATRLRRARLAERRQMRHCRRELPGMAARPVGQHDHGDAALGIFHDAVREAARLTIVPELRPERVAIDPPAESIFRAATVSQRCWSPGDLLHRCIDESMLIDRPA